MAFTGSKVSLAWEGGHRGGSWCHWQAGQFPQPLYPVWFCHWEMSALQMMSPGRNSLKKWPGLHSKVKWKKKVEMNNLWSNLILNSHFLKEHMSNLSERSHCSDVPISARVDVTEAFASPVHFSCSTLFIHFSADLHSKVMADLLSSRDALCALLSPKRSDYSRVGSIKAFSLALDSWNVPLITRGCALFLAASQVEFMNWV